uniref:Uncharacterized protein n=1 Tax=Populus alba TaxID=43335 RepID=A0A4U5R3J5_POPAL|nr:hypothetical protein D5086_0000020800 [Populus alba]
MWMSGSATSIFLLHFYTGGVVHRCNCWEIGAPFKSRFSAPFYCPSVGSPSVMADLVAGSISSSPPLQGAGGEEEQPKRGRRCCWKKEVGLRRRWKSWPRERGQSDALRFVLAKPREKISGRLVVCEKEKNGEEGSCSRLRWRGRRRRGETVLRRRKSQPGKGLRCGGQEFVGEKKEKLEPAGREDKKKKKREWPGNRVR